MRRLAVLASGTGTNAHAILDAVEDGRIRAELALVASDKPDAPVLRTVRARGVATHALDASAIGDRSRYERLLVQELERRGVEVVALAGYMRLCGETFLSRFGGRTLNVHPSLLPAFPGLDALGQALRAGVDRTGVTVHFVDEGIDTGPIVAQQVVHVRPGDTRASLAARVRAVEHLLYPQAVGALVHGKVSNIDGSVVFSPNLALPQVDTSAQRALEPIA